MISVHVEACPHLNRTLNRIRELGCKAGVVLNPATPISFLDEALIDADYVLVCRSIRVLADKNLFPRHGTR